MDSAAKLECAVRNSEPLSTFPEQGIMIKIDKHQASFILLAAVSVALGWRFLFETFSLSCHNDDYTQILFVLPVSVALAFLKRKDLQEAREWNVSVGPLILLIAAAIACGIRFRVISFPADETLCLGMLALVLFWIGISILCFGLRTCERALFSLLFLLALVPLPKVALDWVIAFLQQGSAWSTHALYVVSAVPVIQQGDRLTIPGLIVNVAQECSSIRSSSMLAVTTLVMAHLLLRSFWRKALITALVIPLSIAKNGLRIFTITMLGTRVAPGYLTGSLHRQGGILFFIVALIAISFVLHLLRRGEDSAQRLRSEPLRNAVASN